MKRIFGVLLGVALAAVTPLAAQAQTITINDLPAAATPLNCNEVVAAWQSHTVKISVGALNAICQGPAAPASPNAGQFWFNTTTTAWVLDQYDGAQWVQIGTLDTVAHTWTPVGGGGGSGNASFGTATGNVANDVVSMSNTTTGVQDSGIATSALATVTGAQTLTNKTLTAPVMTAPVLGTPASGNASNLTNIPAAQISGVVPSANGGAGTVSGIVKANGSGTISAAAAGTDYQAPISLTTTGSSGAATLSGNTLNIPQYTGGGGSPGGSTNSVQTNNGSSGFNGVGPGTATQVLHGNASGSPTFGQVNLATDVTGLLPPGNTAVVLGNGGAPITGTTYTINCANDVGKELLFTGSSALAMTLNAATTTGCGYGFGVPVVNHGSANIVITASGNINGSGTKNLLPGESTFVYTDATSATYYTEDGTSNHLQELDANFIGKPVAGEVRTFKVARPFSLPASLTGSQFVITTNPTATWTLTLNKNGSSIGTIAFSTGGTETTTFASTVNFAVGDILTEVCPGTQDSTGADIDINLLRTLN